MIFRKTIDRDQKGFYSVANNFRQTNVVFRKTKPHSQMQINCLPSFRSSNVKNQQVQQPLQQKQKTNQTSCSTFMKNYIERLKKQRKRQNKKHQSLKSKTPTTIDSDNLPLYNTSKPNQILILQKINQSGHKNFINTLSVVSEDLYNIGNAVHKQKQQKSKKTTDNLWVNNQKISQIIRQIKNSKKKNSAIEQLAQLDSLYQIKQMKNTKTNLPKIDKPAKTILKKLSKMQKQKDQYNLKQLQPWKEQDNFLQFTIEEYDAL